MSRSEKSDKQLLAKTWRELHALEWLFPEQETHYDSAEYLQEFHRKYGPMHMNKCPTAYQWKFLERNKDRIAFSNHIIADNAVLPYTMLQFGPQFHVAADWIWEDSKFLLNLNVFYGQHKDYATLLKDNADLEYIEEDNTLGYGGFGGSSHQSRVNRE